MSDDQTRDDEQTQGDEQTRDADTSSDDDDTGPVSGDGEGDNPAADRAGITEKPPPEEIEKIEQERKERLDPDNRPENAEVDNTDRTFEDGEFKD